MFYVLDILIKDIFNNYINAINMPNNLNSGVEPNWL